MTPAEIYKTILDSITQARNVRGGMNSVGLMGLPVAEADDSLLDEMARNAAQAVISFVSLSTPTDLDKLEQLAREEIPLGRGRDEDLYDGVIAIITELRGARTFTKTYERFRQTTREALRELPEEIFAAVAARCRVAPGGCFCGCHSSQVPA